MRCLADYIIPLTQWLLWVPTPLKRFPFCPHNGFVGLTWLSHSTAIIYPTALTDRLLWQRHGVVREVGTKCLRTNFVRTLLLGKVIRKSNWSTQISRSEFQEPSSVTCMTSYPQSSMILQGGHRDARIFFVAQQPKGGIGHIFVEVSRSYTSRYTHTHTR